MLQKRRDINQVNVVWGWGGWDWPWRAWLNHGQHRLEERINSTTQTQTREGKKNPLNSTQREMGITSVILDVLIEGQRLYQPKVSMSRCTSERNNVCLDENKSFNQLTSAQFNKARAASLEAHTFASI
jgi:hypothetical protein